MGNIRDYIYWRGDLPFALSAFNEIDNLIFSCLAYLNLDGIGEVKESGGLTLREAAERFFALHTKEELDADKSFVAQVPAMMREMACSKRFGGCVIRNYVNEILEKEEQQFAAMEILLDDGTSYVAFRGTDDTIVGWKEDFRLSLGVVPAQKRAAEYLDCAGKRAQGMLRVGGHSKGGNLALYAAAECNVQVQENILEIFSNDGPGFPQEFWQTERVRRLLPRWKRIIPEASIVGMLLGQEKEAVIVKSSQRGILQHDGFSWEVIGPSFVRAEELNKWAVSFDGSLHKWIDGMEADQKSALIGDLFSVLEVTGAESISQVQEGGWKNLGIMLRQLEKFPLKSRTMLLELLNGLFAGWVEQLRADTQEKISLLKDGRVNVQT